LFVCYVPVITTYLPDKVKSHEISESEAEGAEAEPMNDEDFGMTGEDLEKLNAADAGPPDAGQAGAAAVEAGAAAEEPAKPEEKPTKGKKEKAAKKAKQPAAE